MPRGTGTDPVPGADLRWTTGGANASRTQGVVLRREGSLLARLGYTCMSVVEVDGLDRAVGVGAAVVR
jgi:hypothetical protein